MNMNLKSMNYIPIYHEKYKSKINESIFIDLIEYYYPNLEIKEEKYICNIGCTLWNKKKN